MSKQFQRDFGVYCCPHIFHKEKPVLLVIRDEDEDWQFLWALLHKGLKG
ncbi:hypothetical protein [Acinetobacter baumannii]